MSQEISSLTIKIMDRDIRIKCPQNKILELKESANYLDRKIKELLSRSEEKILSLEKLTIIAALNIIYELLTLQKQKYCNGDNLKKHITNLQKKVEEALVTDL